MSHAVTAPAPALADAPLDSHVTTLSLRWQDYVDRGTFETFVEFALALNSLTEHFNRLRLPGLVRLSESAEASTLALFGEPSSHPLSTEDLSRIDTHIEALLHGIHAAQPSAEREDQRAGPLESASLARPSEWTKPRSVLVVSEQSHPWVTGLAEQFTFFGFRVDREGWEEEATPEREPPLVVLFIPSERGYDSGQIARVKEIRHRLPGSQLFCLSTPRSLTTMVALMRAGADVTILPDEEVSTVLARVLELIQSREQDPHRVLVVEDSPTATASIQRALTQHGFESHAIQNPQQLLGAVEMYRPDLVLMDMHMPGCSGVEATRVMRQIASCQATPVVYLSSEKDMGMQVEALRLGGDQFLTKPFNPVVLAAVVKTKIERYREMQRWSQHDSLTGLLNHSAAKTRLNQLASALNPARDRLCVAMVDIDKFKSINDNFGHPVGDQVIRSLAWLLKGRLRTSDIVGRYGGEEFLVVMRDATREEALPVLDRIREDFSTLPHAHASGTLRATFSAGLASYPAIAAASELTRVADEALLDAKRQGRNRVICR